MKILYKLLLVTGLLLLSGTLTVFAADDNVAPVFDSKIQTLYLLQRKDTQTTFIPENYIRDLKATDDVDGNDVTINLEYSNVNLSQDGQYQLLYTATDKSGNKSSLTIVVIVDGTGPTFDENEETTYFINNKGIIFDSKYNVIDNLPEYIISKDSMGAYNGIGIYITNDDSGNIVIMDTIDNSPSVGLLMPNDIILEIDNENVRGKGPEETAFIIKDSKSESVCLKILRDGQEMSISIEKAIIKIYADEEYNAFPDIDISSINKEEPAEIKITYTAIDAAGNKSEFIVTVIIIDEEKDDSDIIKEDEDEPEDEELEDITTSGNPPEDINIDFPEDEKILEDQDESIVKEDDTEVLDSTLDDAIENIE